MCGRYPGSRSVRRRRDRWPSPGHRCSDTRACSRPRCGCRSRWPGTVGRCSPGRRLCFPAEGRMGEPPRERQGQLRTERQPPQGTFYDSWDNTSLLSWDNTSLLPAAQDQTKQPSGKCPTLRDRLRPLKSALAWPRIRWAHRIKNLEDLHTFRNYFKTAPLGHHHLPDRPNVSFTSQKGAKLQFPFSRMED